MIISLLTFLISFQLGSLTAQGQVDSQKSVPDSSQQESKGEMKWILIDSEKQIPEYLPEKIKLKIPGLLKSYAKDQKYGVVLGNIINLNNIQMAGTSVALSGAAMMAARTQLTNEDGLFTFIQIPAGKYTCEMQLVNYSDKLVQSDIEVAVGKITYIEAKLAPAGPEVIHVTQNNWGGPAARP